MGSQPSVEEHNQQVLDELEPGDMVEFDRGIYKHYAIYIGEGRLVHLRGDEGASGWSHAHSSFSGSNVLSDKATVKEDKFWDVAKGCRAKKSNEKDEKYRPRSKSEIVQTAKERLGRREGYNIFNNNCETFSNECRYGLSESTQGQHLASGIWGTLAVLLGAGAIIGVVIAKASNRRAEQ